MNRIIIYLIQSALSLSVIEGNAPEARVQSGYIRISNAPNELSRRNNLPDYYNAPPVRSYVIYDTDIASLPDISDRPQIFTSPRAWHLQFNQRNEPWRNQPPTDVSYHTVSSNLIQVVDEPYQRKYFGPFDGKAYLDSSKRYPDFMRPLDVPKYEVLYPYNHHKDDKVYETVKLPDKFPSPFLPNVNFKLKDPPPVDSPRRDFGFYSTETVNYFPDASLLRRNGAKGMCNYIRLNEKGFPVGNEMCGRTVSDLILSEAYPTTGELVLEHRKRYRGSFASIKDSQNFESIRSLKNLERNKRNAPEYRTYVDPYGASNYPSRSCCFDTSSGSYGYRDYNNQQTFSGSPGYNDQRFTSDQGYRGNGRYDGYGYRQGEGQTYYDNTEDNIRGDTSNNYGLTSYLTNRGRGRDHYNDSDESDEDDEYKEDRSSRSNNSNNTRNNHQNKKNSSSDNKNSRNNTSSDRNRSHGGSKKRNNNHRGSDEDNYDNDDDNHNEWNNRSGHNKYGYVRTYDSTKNSGSGDGTHAGRSYSSRGDYGSYDASRSYDSRGSHGSDSYQQENYGSRPSIYSNGNGDSRFSNGDRRGYNSSPWYSSSSSLGFGRGSSGYGYDYGK